MPAPPSAMPSRRIDLGHRPLHRAGRRGRPTLVVATEQSRSGDAGCRRRSSRAGGRRPAGSCRHWSAPCDRHAVEDADHRRRAARRPRVRLTPHGRQSGLSRRSTSIGAALGIDRRPSTLIAMPSLAMPGNGIVACWYARPRPAGIRRIAVDHAAARCSRTIAARRRASGVPAELLAERQRVSRSPIRAAPSIAEVVAPPLLGHADAHLAHPDDVVDVSVVLLDLDARERSARPPHRRRAPCPVGRRQRVAAVRLVRLGEHGEAMHAVIVERPGRGSCGRRRASCRGRASCAGRRRRLAGRDGTPSSPWPSGRRRAARGSGRLSAAASSS